MEDPALREALGTSQRLGMLGDRPIDEVVAHASVFVTALAAVTGTVIDLGSGGGVPGLVIARARPDLQVILVDRRAARTDHLQRLVGRLDLAARVTVLNVDADALRLSVDAVVARGFGAPATTLRLAAPLVRDGGLIVVSEPPHTAADRWPAAGLAELELQAVPSRDPRVACFRRRSAPSCST